MCPRDSQTRKIGYMPVADFSLILERIGPFKGIFHLHGFGETLLDRQFIPKIRILKAALPEARTLIFSTLGVRVKEDYFDELVDAGLDDLAISFYGFTQESYKKVHGFDGLELVKRNLERLSLAMKRPGVTLKPTIKIPSLAVSSSLPIAQPPERAEFCRWALDLGFDIMEWSYVHNYGDGRKYNAPNTERLCPVINGNRKNILNITWDLKVVPCCYDFNATIPFGNLRDQTLEEIFASPEYFQFLLAHQTNELSAYSVCQNCEKYDYE